MHSLKTSPRKNAGQQEGRSKDQFVSWDPNATLGKRKREDNEPLEIQTVSPHMLSKLPMLDALSDLPELTYSGPASPPDTEPSCPDGFQAMSDEGRISLAEDDALFSTFLRSRSPSCCSGKADVEETAALETLSDTRAGVSRVADFDCVQSMEQDEIKSPESPPRAKTPRLILRVRPLETKTKPKKMPRPKQSQKQPQKHQAKKSITKSQPIPKIKLRFRKPSQPV